MLRLSLKKFRPLINQKPISTQRFALIVSTLLLITKVIAYYVTKSNTILTDALESIVNVLAGIFALYGIWLAMRPRDKNHPYGHGKVEFLSSGVEGILITLAGIAMIYKSVNDLLHPHQIYQLNTGIYLIGATGLINGALGYYIIWQGKKAHSVLMEGNGKHLLSDAISTAGILIGLAIIQWTNWVWLDNVFAMTFGVIIIITGYKIIRKSVAGVMDEADSKIIEKLVSLLESNRKPQWIDIHNFRVIKYGAVLHVDCHVTLPWYITIKEGHRLMDEIEAMVNDELERQVEFFIHMDPCDQHSCPVCTVVDCPHRKHLFKEKIGWTPENIRQNKRHSVD